jgi:hypothetical protein
MTPAQEAKARVYRRLGYRLAGMVGEHLTVARPSRAGAKGSATSHRAIGSRDRGINHRRGGRYVRPPGRLERRQLPRSPGTVSGIVGAWM